MGEPLSHAIASKNWNYGVIRTAAILLLTLALSGCGMGRAAHSTAQIADKYGCLAKELKGEAPCQPEGAQPQPDGSQPQ